MSLHSQNQNTFTPQQSQAHHLAFPALHLHPHNNDTFIPKQIALNPNGAKVKIGRQTNQKTVPNSLNGYFDSKVLSRAHAEVWTEDGKVLIRDVKSSNGTFINGERLSTEGVESEAFELHTDDVVEFGIDIIADDNKSVVHHKVATKVFLVLNADDALAASNFYRANASDAALNRRANRPGVFAGGSFDHVLNRLQSELEKSRVTGQELSTLNSAMNEIHDTLGGGAGPPPPLPPPYGGRIPPLNHQPQIHQTNALQAQLTETQASLTSHIEKMKALEGLMGEHEQLKREVGELRDQVECTRRDSHAGLKAVDEVDEERMRGRVSPVAAMLELQERQQAEAGEDDDDDTRSMASADTVTWITNSLQKTHLKPNGISAPNAMATTVDASQLESLLEQNQKLTERIDVISAHVEDTLKVGSSLMEQHRESTETISQLKYEIQHLKHQQEQQRQHYESFQSLEQSILEKAESKWTSWKEVIETGWRQQQETWEVERQKLLKVIQEWEEKSALDRESASDEDELLARASSSTSVGASPFSTPSKMKKSRKKKISNAKEMLVESSASTHSLISPNRSPQKVKKQTDLQGLDGSPARHLSAMTRTMEEHSDASDATMTRAKSATTQTSPTDRTTSQESERGPDFGVKAGREKEGGGAGRSMIDVR